MSLLNRYLGVSLFILFLAGCTPSTLRKIPITQLGNLEKPFVLSGVLTEDLIVGGVIRLTGDLIIPAGRSLQIEPGSQIRIVGTDSTKIDPEFLDKGTEILVKGSLLLNGRSGAEITVSLDEETPRGENWTGFELVKAENATFNFVDIIGAETGVLSIDSSPLLDHVNILGSRYGLLLQGRSVLSFSQGRITGGDAGLLCFDRSTVQLTDLQIVDNLEEGLYLADGCTLIQQRLNILRNDIGLVAPAGMRSSTEVTLSNNRIDFMALPGLEQSK